MAHSQKPEIFFLRNGRVHLNRLGNQFIRLLAGDLFTSACRVCTACASLGSAAMWCLLATHFIRQFPLQFSSRASPCANTFQTQSSLLRLYGHTRNFVAIKLNFLTDHRLQQRWRQWRREGHCISEVLKASNWTSVHIDSMHLPSLALLLTPWSRVLLEKLTGFQLVKKFLAFYGTRKFITAFTSARHLSLSWASSIQPYPHILLPEDPS
jgi:hypothetical protein